MAQIVARMRRLFNMYNRIKYGILQVFKITLRIITYIHVGTTNRLTSIFFKSPKYTLFTRRGREGKSFEQIAQLQMRNTPTQYLIYI